ncbi:MAG TPA: VWA domain-containing protein [Gemmatimonadaceae bacterium]|nr:VWA domain-containing protein [Gemmatimonadaceae bacterium]
MTAETITGSGEGLVGFTTRFCRALRERGVPASTGAAIDAVRALDAVDLGDRADVHLALRALLVSRHEELATFDELFDAWWGAPRVGSAPNEDRKRGARAPNARGATDAASPRAAPAATFLTRWAASAAAADDDGTVPLAAPSPHDAAGAKDFAAYAADELDAVEQAAARIARRLRARPGRRWRSAPRGARVDLRRLVRRSLRTGGEPVELTRRERKPRRTKLVVLCDVSGSMDLYSRFLLQFLFALQHAFARVETFAFSTRLARITDSLRRDSYREALDALARLSSAAGWSGGTRIGGSLEAFRSRWSRLLDRRTVVIVLSDGWDTGDPDVLAGALRAIARRAGRVVWLNPLLGSPTYRPLTRGMQAALPYVDVFAPAHDLASLEKLATHLSL